MSKLLGLVLPTNNPSIMYKYLLSSIENIQVAKDYIEFLINFQSPYTEVEINDIVSKIRSYGIEVKYTYSTYEVKGKGLVPFNRIREDTTVLDKDCEYYMLLDDDMTFLGSSAKMPRTSGEQLLEALIYLKKNPKCGIFVCGGSLIKKIPLDTIAPIDYNREYVTGRGLIFKNIGKNEGWQLVPVEAHDLLGSDEEKVEAAARIARGYYVSEMPFVRINHYENQVSQRNKNGKIPGSVMYNWNTQEIRDQNNHKFIRDHYNPEYTSGKGNVVSIGIADGHHYSEYESMDFSSMSTSDLINELQEVTK